LSHQVAPHHVEEAAYLLKACYRYFPDGTVHVVVVDPGVGSSRRPLLVTTSRHFFVAPDNGILTYIYEEESSVEVRQIENRQYRLDAEGATFDGRDVFAPAAAWLTKGQAPGSFGRLIRDQIHLTIAKPTWHEQRLVGQVVYVDQYGNLISNLTADHLSEVQARRRGEVTIRIDGITILGLVTHYAEGKTRDAHALINSNGQLEIFVKEGNAAQVLNSGSGHQVELS
jgi:S-adenosylmethionine hydrolase